MPRAPSACTASDGASTRADYSRGAPFSIHSRTGATTSGGKAGIPSGNPIPNADLLHHQVDRFQLQMFKHLLDRLTEYDSPYGGQLLDDCVACWTNDLGNGPPHSGNNLPWILAGGAAGCLRTGQYIGLETHQKNSTILNTILTAVGCTADDGGPVEDFGDGQAEPGRVDALVV